MIFCYFNVAGAAFDTAIGELHLPETHLMPLIFQTIDGKCDSLTIYGTVYDTPDGTCIPDDAHVCDLVDAHTLGLKWIENNKNNAIFNLFTGTDYSVREVLEHAQSVTNDRILIIEGNRCIGDASKLVSGSSFARNDLGWDPARSTISQMVDDAWKWYRSSRPLK